MLQEVLGIDDVFGCLWVGGIQWIYGYFINVQGISIVVVIDVIWSYGVFQGFVYFVVFLVDFFIVVVEFVVFFFYFGSWDVNVMGIGVGISLDVVLVEQVVVWFFGGNVIEVEEDFVLEMGVEQV